VSSSEPELLRPLEEVSRWRVERSGELRLSSVREAASVVLRVARFESDNEPLDDSKLADSAVDDDDDDDVAEDEEDEAEADVVALVDDDEPELSLPAKAANDEALERRRREVLDRSDCVGGSDFETAIAVEAGVESSCLLLLPLETTVAVSGGGKSDGDSAAAAAGSSGFEDLADRWRLESEVDGVPSSSCRFRFPSSFDDDDEDEDELVVGVVVVGHGDAAASQGGDVSADGLRYGDSTSTAKCESC